MNFDECANELFKFARDNGYKITKLEIEKICDKEQNVSGGKNE